MKKFFLALMCVATLAMVGCSNKSNDPVKDGTNVKDADPAKVDNTVSKCWAIGMTGKVNDIEESKVNYYWGTEKAVVLRAQDDLAEYEEMAKKWGLTLEVTIKYSEATPETEEACQELDKAAEKEYEESGECWKITISAGTIVSEDVYMWGHESAVLIGEIEAKQMAEAYLAPYIEQYGLKIEVKTSHEKADYKDPDSCEAQNKGLTGMPELLKK